MKKRILSLLVMLTMMCAFMPCIHAAEIVDSGECGAQGDNLTWTLDSDGTLTINGTGEMTDWVTPSNVPWYSHKERIKSLNINDNVTSIGSYAFEDCILVSYVTIPNKVTDIGNHAFENCISLLNVTIPKNVTKIRTAAFRGCVKITKATIPSSVTSIGGYPFAGCKNLAYISVDSSNEKYCSVDGVLFNKDKTEIMQFPAGNTQTIYNIPDSVTSLGAYSFENCTSLTDISIPNSVTSAGNYPFSGCSGLKNVTVPANVFELAVPYMFANCTNIEYINVDENNESYTSIDGVLFNKSGTELVQYPAGNYRTVYKIPDSTTRIYSGAFKDSTHLTSITIPDNVTNIGNRAFENCISLTDIAFPDNTTKIGSYMFSGCESLKSITIPDSVTDIEDYAFSGCDNLQNIYYSGTQEQWSNINIEYGNSYYISNSAIYCSDGIIGMAWSIDENGTLTLSGSGEVKSNSALSAYSDSVKAIIIENGLTSINYSVFGGYTNLKTVTISESITSIGNYVFDACPNLENIDVNTENQYYSSENGILFNKDKTELITYPRGKSEQSYTVPDSVTNIAVNSFEGCSSLTSVILPDTLKGIGDYAFFGCVNLTSLVIPSSVISIGEKAVGSYEYGEFFFGKGYAGYPVTIYGHKGSAAETYALENNQVNKDKSFDMKVTFMAYEINDGKAVITDCTPYDGGSTGLTILNSVENCSLNEISANAFTACNNLTDVYYGGSEAEWNKLTINSDNSNLTNADIHYNNVMPFFVKNYSDLRYITENEEAIIIGCSNDDATLIEIPSEIDGIAVKSIGGGGYFYGNNINSIIIPDTVESIGNYVFGYCENLSDIYYSGSIADWEKISIGEHNEYFINAILHPNAIGTASPTIASVVCGMAGTTPQIRVSLADTEYDSTMITAFYNDGVLVDMQTTLVSSNDAEKIVPVTDTDADMAKVMIWSSMDSMKPLCDIKEIPII